MYQSPCAQLSRVIPNEHSKKCIILPQGVPPEMTNLHGLAADRSLPLQLIATELHPAHGHWHTVHSQVSKTSNMCDQKVTYLLPESTTVLKSFFLNSPNAPIPPSGTITPGSIRSITQWDQRWTFVKRFLTCATQNELEHRRMYGKCWEYIRNFPQGINYKIKIKNLQSTLIKRKNTSGTKLVLSCCIYKYWLILGKINLNI